MNVSLLIRLECKLERVVSVSWTRVFASLDPKPTGSEEVNTTGALSKTKEHEYSTVNGSQATAHVNVLRIASNRLQASCVTSVVGCLTASNAMFYVTSFISTPFLQRYYSAGSDGSDMLLAVPPAKSSLT